MSRRDLFRSGVFDDWERVVRSPGCVLARVEAHNVVALADNMLGTSIATDHMVWRCGGAS